MNQHPRYTEWRGDDKPAHAADLERGEDRCLPRHAESLEGLLPETEGEA